MGSVELLAGQYLELPAELIPEKSDTAVSGATSTVLSEDCDLSDATAMENTLKLLAGACSAVSALLLEPMR